MMERFRGGCVLGGLDLSDILTSSDFSTTASVLIIQQYNAEKHYKIIDEEFMPHRPPAPAHHRNALCAHTFLGCVCINADSIAPLLSETGSSGGRSGSGGPGSGLGGLGSGE